MFSVNCLATYRFDMYCRTAALINLAREKAMLTTVSHSRAGSACSHSQLIYVVTDSCNWLLLGSFIPV